jgi:RHS repeat-associated protein
LSGSTAKERDKESGLDYFLARYYASSLGRFNRVDPMNAGAAPSNPQSWNGYSYVFNNPLLFVDPTGEVTQICGLGGEDDCSTVTEDTADAVRQDSSYIVANQSIYVRNEDGTQGQQIGTFAYQGPDGKLSAAGQAITEDLEGRADQSKGTIAEFAGAAVVGGTGAYAIAAGSQAVNVAAFGPATGRVFWSGGEAAFNAAAAVVAGGSGLRMFHQTPAGAAIVRFADRVPSLAGAAFRVGSRFFASGAQGPVQAVVRSPRSNSILVTTELPRLASRPGGLSSVTFR